MHKRCIQTLDYGVVFRDIVMNQSSYQLAQEIILCQFMTKPNDTCFFQDLDPCLCIYSRSWKVQLRVRGYIYCRIKLHP